MTSRGATNVDFVNVQTYRQGRTHLCDKTAAIIEALSCVELGAAFAE